MDEVKTENDKFIIQASKDYDMNVSDVCRIYNLSNKDKSNFYDLLEEFILHRN